MNSVCKKILLFLALLIVIILKGEITISNAGVPGNSSKQALERLERDVLAEKPYAVIILLGTNDALNPNKIAKPEAYKKNLLSICNSLQQNGVKKIVLITPFPAVESILRRRSPKINSLVPPPLSLEEHIKKYGDVVFAVAKELNLTVINSFEFFVANGGAVDTKNSLFRTYANSKTHDGIHLNSIGYSKFAAWLGPKVKPLLPENCHLVCLGDSITYGVHVKGAGTVMGDTYPAKLWNFLNENLVKQGKKPTRVIFSFSKNLIPNSLFNKLDKNGFPANWKFNKKDKDLAKVDKGGYLHVVRNSPTPALVRTNPIKIVPGKYRWALQLKGKGIATISFSFYHPVKHIEVKRVNLSSTWQKVTGEIVIPKNVTQFLLTIRIHNFADIKDAKVSNLSFYKENNIKKQTYVPSLFINSNKLKLSLSSCDTGAVITSIKNNKNVQFINFNPACGIWSIRLKRKIFDKTKLPPITAIACDPEMDDSADSIGKDGESSNDVIIDSTMAKKMGAICSVEEKAGKIFLHWKNISINKQKNALDVGVCISRNSKGGIEFNGNIINRSKEYTVFYFNYPQISGLGKINGRMEDDFLATPHYLGRLIKNPASGKILNGSRLFRSNNSGHSMHFDAIYSKNLDGLFFGVWDSKQNSKRWDLTSSLINGFGWTCVNIPNNMKCSPIQQWTIPYSIEIQSFNGDWYDAAQIYRNWAIKQEWCSKGTLLQRRNQDIPEWFLDTTCWLHVSVDNLLKGQKIDCEKYFSDFQDHKIGIWLTHWGVDNKRYDFPNPDRFPLTSKDKIVLSKLKEAGYSISGYIQLTAWTKTMPIYKANPNAENNLLRNFYGQILSWGGTGYRKDSMLAYPGKLWQNVLTQVVGKMVDSGFSVAYLDSGNHGGAHLNFTPSCSKNSGGGNDYVQNNRKLLTVLREEGRKKNPNFCTTTESFWEGNLHCLDAVMCVNSPSAYLESDRVTAIPLAPAVYHDYAQLFATHYGRGDLKGSAQGVIAKTAQALLWGIMPGWELPHAMYRFSNPQRVLKTSKQRMAAYDAGRKYLQYGKMLRPPIIKGDNPIIEIPWGIGWRDAVYNVKSSAVIGTTYEAKDGTLGIVLYNMDKTLHDVIVQLDNLDYTGDKSSFHLLYPNNIDFETNLKEIKISLPPQTPVILETKLYI